MGLTNFIYDFNLATTKTVTNKYERCSIINNGRTKEIEYSDCISLYDLVETFNFSYIDYMEEKDKFRVILNNLGEEVFYEFHTFSDKFSAVYFNVINPYPIVFDEDYARIHFVNNEDNYYVCARNEKRLFDKNYKNKIVYLKEETIKIVLELVKRHSLFLESFRKLSSHTIANEPTTVCTKITGDLFRELTTFTLSFGNSFLCSDDFIEVKFKLGNNFKIFYNKSKVILNDKPINNLQEKKNIINELLSSIYISTDKLPGLYKAEEKKQYVKMGGK